MPRAWTGVLTIEGVQTGDGRVIAEGAIEWSELPLPLAWLEQEQHGNLLAGGVQVGTIDMIERVGNEIRGSGMIDDDNPDGAEVVRRMEAGTAPGGSRFFVSIDADDYEVEIIAPEGMDDADILVIGAAGEPDPGPGGGPDGELLFEMAADEIIERATRLRIRGATLCAVSAFDGAFITLDGMPEPADMPAEEDEDMPEEEMAVAAAPRPIAAHAVEVFAPPAAFFTDPQLDGPQRWVTIEPDGRLYGHLAVRGECHIGILDRCVTVDEIMEGGFEYAMPGHVDTAEGDRVGTGVIAVKGGHADLSWDWRRAQAHYDDPETGVADVVYGADEHGLWFSGVVRPWAPADHLYMLRASGVSLDARPIGNQVRLIAACCVNTPGFPKLRARVASGELTAIVAAGGRPRPDPRLSVPWPPTATPRDDGRMDALERRVARVERVTEAAVLASLEERVRPTQPA